MAEFSPWVEKYRPSRFEDIVLDPINKTILNNIIEGGYFPNLLFYGPPGTGKTTTVINLIDRYQRKYQQKRRGLKIHLNASDDRGIDIIRNQINTFVHTKALFGDGVKFIILDEIDYMTKNAQQALRYLISSYARNIRFCLICNYISRIDTALQNEFIRLRFCQLPTPDILNFLDHIQKKEKLNMQQKQLVSIQKTFKSDIRSMINYLQSNHEQFKKGMGIEMPSKKMWEELIMLFQSHAPSNDILKFIENKCTQYSMGNKHFIKGFIDYLVKYKKYVLQSSWLSTCKYIIHSGEAKDAYIANYFVVKFLDLYKLL